MTRAAELRLRLRNLLGLEQRIADLERRVPLAHPLHGQWMTLERFDAGAAGEVIGYRDGAPSGDGTYLALENAFRGSGEYVRDRMRAYLAVISPHPPVLDVGCGRGELLELLRDEGVSARGVDADPAMVEHCHRKGLDNVTQAHALAHLEAVPRGSLGSIVASHVLEHLPYEELLRFLRLSARALAPDGVLLISTPNPHSPQALKHFWIDPTHHHPLFAEVMLVLFRESGFRTAYIWYPGATGDPARDAIEQLDYSIVAHAPMAAALNAPLRGAIAVSTDVGELWYPDDVDAGSDRAAAREAVQEIVAPGMTVIDVGAGVGYRALLAARRAGADGRVIALEPVRDRFTLLRANVARAGADTVTVTHAAASGQPGMIDLPVPAGLADSHSRRVPAVRLDDLLLSHERVDCILIHAPRAEREVLDGLQETIARCEPAIRVLS